MYNRLVKPNNFKYKISHISESWKELKFIDTYLKNPYV